MLKDRINECIELFIDVFPPVTVGDFSKISVKFQIVLLIFYEYFPDVFS